MLNRKTALLAAAAAMMTAASPALAQKQVIANASDLPPVVIELPAKPSAIVTEGGPAYDSIQDQVEAYAERVLRDYDVRDRGTEQQLLSLLLQSAMIENRWDDVIAYSQRIEALEEKASAKATAGLLTRSYARAAKAVGEDSPQFADRFQQEFQRAVQAVDWTLGQDTL